MGVLGIIAGAAGALILLYGAVIAWAWWEEIGAWGWGMWCRFTWTRWHQLWRFCGQVWLRLTLR